jgi:hypothetical protein
MSAILRHLPTLERALVAKGFPEMSAWWRATVTRFYRSARRQLVLRVGRRGGKSSTLCRLAVLEALYGGHVVAPGDVGVVAIVSVSLAEAGQRLRTVKAVLDALSVKWKPCEGGIELVGRPVAFRVFAASVAGVVGFTCIGAICDEVARWRDADTGANPATEVLASLRPTLAGQAHARIFLSSSPLGTLDAHAVAFDAGESDFQAVAFAETWVARPTLTEAETRALEPDERVWRREYGAIPQSGSLACFDAEAVERAFGQEVVVVRGGPPFMVLDPSSGRKDSWTWGVGARVELADGTERLRFALIEGVGGKFSDKLSGDVLVDRLAGVAREWGVDVVVSDQRESYLLSSAFQKRGLRFRSHDWTSVSKIEGIERLRRWLLEGYLVLPEHEKLRRELLTFEERIAPSGAFTFGARGSGSDDYVALLITAALADIKRRIKSPAAPPADDPGPTRGGAGGGGPLTQAQQEMRDRNQIAWAARVDRIPAG